MEIVREIIDEIEDFKRQCRIGDVPYHKITVTYVLRHEKEPKLEITKKINYCWGHCDYEMMDEISYYGYTVVFKTHNIKKLTKQLEQDCIKRLNEEIKNIIKEKQNEISDLYNSIEEHTKSIKGFSKFFREEKINRITDE